MLQACLHRWIWESGGLCSHRGVMLRGGQIVNECSICGVMVRDGRVARCRSIGSGSETDVPVE